MIYFVTSVRLLEFTNFCIDLNNIEKVLEDFINEPALHIVLSPSPRRHLRLGCLKAKIFTYS